MGRGGRGMSEDFFQKGMVSRIYICPRGGLYRRSGVEPGKRRMGREGEWCSDPDLDRWSWHTYMRDADRYIYHHNDRNENRRKGIKTRRGELPQSLGSTADIASRYTCKPSSKGQLEHLPASEKPRRPACQHPSNFFHKQTTVTAKRAWALEAVDSAPPPPFTAWSNDTA